MKSAIIVFPGSNCDRDVAVTLKAITGEAPRMVWHSETNVPKVDLIVLPGGFSYGDYLRSGAMAAHSPIMKAIKSHVERGGYLLGICNGFQILTETSLLPGVLTRNRSLKYICKNVRLTVERNDTAFTKAYTRNENISIPVAHKDGAYYAIDSELDRLEGEGQIVLRYGTAISNEVDNSPNGSKRNIAAIIDRTGRIMGMMPHPERAANQKTGQMDGCRLFESLTQSLH